MSAKLLKAFGKGPLPGETEAQRKEKALGVLAAMLSEGRITKPKTISAPGFKPSRIATLVLSTVNAPYNKCYSSQELAALLAEPETAARHDQAVFAFFSEVDVRLQISFLKEEGISLRHAISVARSLSALAGYDLPLAQAKPNLLDAEGKPNV